MKTWTHQLYLCLSNWMLCMYGFKASTHSFNVCSFTRNCFTVQTRVSLTFLYSQRQVVHPLVCMPINLILQELHSFLLIRESLTCQHSVTLHSTQKSDNFFNNPITGHLSFISCLQSPCRCPGRCHGFTLHSSSTRTSDLQHALVSSVIRSQWVEENEMKKLDYHMIVNDSDGLCFSEVHVSHIERCKHQAHSTTDSWITMHIFTGTHN